MSSESVYSSLHTHSQFSLKDSIIRPQELIDRLKELGQTAVAITDHGNLYAGISIYKLCKANGIKYIHGIEFYICDDVTVKDKDSKYYHLIALCKNEQGRLNLNKLVSLSELPENFYYKPRIDFKMLQEYGEGFVICSACMAGEISRFLETGNREEARRRALMYKEQFGEDYYIEIQSHNDSVQIGLNKQLVELANELGIEVVVTTDAHYTRQEDRKYQNLYAYSGKYMEDGEAYVDCYIQSEEEVREKISYLDPETIDKCIRNTRIIADKCNVELPLSAPIMPRVDTPPEYKDNVSWLRSICEEGCRRKLGFDLNTLATTAETAVPEEQRKSYQDRYEYEIDALSRMGFVDYTLLVYSYANVGKRRGKGRGSGGGSIVNYFANITDVDPIEHGLFFERYVDVSALGALERGEITAKELKIPDIDLDFSGEDCKKVLRWLKDRYGEERVASIGKFGTNKTKGCIKDMCRVMDIDLTTAEMISKSFGEFQVEDIDALVESGEKIPDNMQEPYGFMQQYPRLFEFVRKLSGLPVSFGLHACGRVVSVDELDYYLPSCYDNDGVRYLQGDMHDVEDVGLVKVDILGLRTLDHEYDALELSGNGEEFINPKQKYDDEKVWELFRRGDTTGIFQFASNGMKETLRKMDASHIEELSIANALFRPGAMANIDSYCNRKHGTEKTTYYHPDLEPILESTYGIIVFQEQLIQIARLAKMHNPDILRKMVGKKSTALIPVVKPELHDGLIARGWTEDQFNKLWEVILASCSYMFNKCVAGDTQFQREQRKAVRSPSVEETYLIMNDSKYANQHGYFPLRGKYQRYGYPQVQSLYPDGKIRPNKIIDIQPSGVRQLYKVVTSTGKWVECTDNHKFPTPNGEKKLSDLRVGDVLYIKGEYTKKEYNYCFTDGNFIPNVPKKGEMGFQHNPDGNSVKFNNFKTQCTEAQLPCSVCGKAYREGDRFEVHHKNKDRTNNEPYNLQWCCVSCHKKKLDYQLGRTHKYENGIPTLTDEIVSIEPTRTAMTYDVTMADPAHTFVVNNGLVVSNSHSSAYAILAYMTAKLKAHYPAEFFAGLLSSYIGNGNFTKESPEIFADIARHKITYVPFSFRDDHRKCSVRDGKIIYALPLVKDMNCETAEILYNNRDFNGEYFCDLLKVLYDDGLRKATLSALISLDMFNEFGNSRQLQMILDAWELAKWGIKDKMMKKSASKNLELDKIISSHSTDLGASGKVTATYSNINWLQVMHEYEDKVRAANISEVNIKVKVMNQRDKIGLAPFPTGKEEDRSLLFVTDVKPVCNRSTGTQFGYSVFTSSFGSGIQTRFTVKGQQYREWETNPIKQNDIIRCLGWTNERGYFNLTKWSQIYV